MLCSVAGTTTLEDDDQFESDVNASISSVVENICQKKSDVSSITKDLKIPGNCRSLVPPQVNPEIWQFLERRTKSDDLHSQTIQKLIGAGLIPIIQVAEILRTKTPSIKEMRDLISKAIAIMSSAHFELKRFLHLKPHIDKRFHQLYNHNEPVGAKLFGDEVSKRLKEISEVYKINTNMASKNFMRGKPYYRRPQQNQRWDRTYSSSSQYQSYLPNQRRPNYATRNCRQQYPSQNKRKF